MSAAEGHVFHNRLTHTLEVAQLAQRLAQKLIDEQPDLARALGGIEPEVTEAAALAHDLGHPPFGHVAESELDRIITDHLGIRDGFEGNAQTFRVVTKLSVRHVGYLGQNLTRATLNAILKYPWTRGAVGLKRRKYGAYETEREDFDWARVLQPDGAMDEKSVEAEIMDWADDIAYAVHDMEDFYRAGFIPLEYLMDEENEELTTFIDGTFRRWRLERFRPVRRQTNPELRNALESLIEQLRETEPILEPYSGTRKQRANLRSLTSLLISRYVSAISLREPDARNRRSVQIRAEAEREITMLKQLAWFYVIQRPSLAGQQRGQRRLIGELFEIFVDATSTVKGRDLLPMGARQFLEETRGRSLDEATRARVAADVVCSLSEQQAVALHQRLTGVEPGSVLQGLLP